MRVRIIALTTLGPGAVLTLTPAQVRDRRHALAPLGEDRYAVVAAVQFKVGEVLGVEGGLPKAMAEQFETAAETAPGADVGAVRPASSVRKRKS